VYQQGYKSPADADKASPAKEPLKEQ